MCRWCGNSMVNRLRCRLRFAPACARHALPRYVSPRSSRCRRPGFRGAVPIPAGKNAQKFSPAPPPECRARGRNRKQERVPHSIFQPHDHHLARRRMLDSVVNQVDQRLLNRPPVQHNSIWRVEVGGWSLQPHALFRRVRFHEFHRGFHQRNELVAQIRIACAPVRCAKSPARFR